MLDRWARMEESSWVSARLDRNLPRPINPSTPNFHIRHNTTARAARNASRGHAAQPPGGAARR